MQKNPLFQYLFHQRKLDFITFRLSSVQIDSHNAISILKTASELVKKTTYSREAFREYAPNKTDCLTAIHYIFKKSVNINIPLTFIRDMPRKLISLKEWDLIECPIENIQCGDVFFTKNTNKPKLISHVALVIDPNKIFHCTPLLQKAVIESKEEFFLSYEQELSAEETICYVDKRNEELRAKEGMFISIEKILQGNFFREKEESFVPVCQLLC